MDVVEKLKSLGWTLPPAPKPIAAYVPAVRTGNLLFISGQLPMREGKLTAAGPVSSQTSIEQAAAAAAQCAVNALAILSNEIAGDWTRLQRVVRVGVFVQSDPGFADQPKVANGASELLAALFGDRGQHARAAVGAIALPLGATVEAEFLFEVK